MFSSSWFCFNLWHILPESVSHNIYRLSVIICGHWASFHTCFVKALWLQLRSHARPPGLALWHLRWLQRGGDDYFLHFHYISLFHYISFSLFSLPVTSLLTASNRSRYFQPNLTSGVEDLARSEVWRGGKRDLSARCKFQSRKGWVINQLEQKKRNTFKMQVPNILLY